MTLLILLFIGHIAISVYITGHSGEDEAVGYFMGVGLLSAVLFLIMSAVVSASDYNKELEPVTTYLTTSVDGLEHTGKGFVFYEVDKYGVSVPVYVEDAKPKFDIETPEKVVVGHDNTDTWWKIDFDKITQTEYYYPSDVKIISRAVENQD